MRLLSQVVVSFKFWVAVIVMRLLTKGIRFDGLFGPAYKGIPLASSVAMAFAEADQDYPVVVQSERSQEPWGGRITSWRTFNGPDFSD